MNCEDSHSINTGRAFIIHNSCDRNLFPTYTYMYVSPYYPKTKVVLLIQSTALQQKETLIKRHRPHTLVSRSKVNFGGFMVTIYDIS